MAMRPTPGLLPALAALCLLAVPAAQAATVYTGTWTNTTFNSTGPVSFVVDIAGSDISVTADFDGSVFGLGDPDPITVSGTITGGVGSLSLTDDPVFGDVSGSVDLVSGAVSGTASDVPAPFIHSASVTGLASATAIDLDYTVCFNATCALEGSEVAYGTISATVVPLPGAVWLLGGALAGLGVLARRRTQ